MPIFRLLQYGYEPQGDTNNLDQVTNKSLHVCGPAILLI